MTLRSWLKQFEGYDDSFLEKEILIECPNGLLVTPKIVRKMKNINSLVTIENIEALVVVP